MCNLDDRCLTNIRIIFSDGYGSVYDFHHGSCMDIYTTVAL